MSDDYNSVPPTPVGKLVCLPPDELAAMRAVCEAAEKPHAIWCPSHRMGHCDCGLSPLREAVAEWQKAKGGTT